MWANSVFLMVLFHHNHGMRVRKEASLFQDLEGGDPVLPVLSKDFNPIGEGTIVGGHSLLIDIFGQEPGEVGTGKGGKGGKGDEVEVTTRFITVEDLRRLSIDRRFPNSYDKAANFPNPHHVVEENPQPRKTIPQRQKDHVLPRLRNINFIICPFLSTMVAEGAVPLKQKYSKDELLNATKDAGLDADTAQSHVDGNFLNNPSDEQDIWNMEGATNEHVTSTGIHDCITTFSGCAGEPPRALCAASTIRECDMPNTQVFNAFIEAVDANDDERITKDELEAAAAEAESQGFTVNVQH